MSAAATRELEQLYPWVRWREPIKVTDARMRTHFACRVCIALNGLNETDVTRQPRTKREWEAHFALAHGKRLQ